MYVLFESEKESPHKITQHSTTVKNNLPHARIKKVILLSPTNTVITNLHTRCQEGQKTKKNCFSNQK